MNESPDISQSVAQTLLNVTVSDITPDILLCAWTGEVDLLTEPLLREKLAEAIDVASHHLVIDLSGVHFLGSIGLQILIELRDAQRDTWRQLVIVTGNNRMVTRPLQITGLDCKFDLHADLATAVKACRTAETVRKP
jgi:anti-sigma B factor antagonist